MVSFDSDGDDEDEGSCFSMFKVLRRDDDVVLVVVLLMKLFTLQVVVLLWQLTGHAFKSWQDVLHLVRSEISACVTTCQYIKKQVPPHNTHSLIPIIRQYTCACDGCFPLKFPTFTPSLLPPLPSFTVVLKAPRNVGKTATKQQTQNSTLSLFEPLRQRKASMVAAIFDFSSVLLILLLSVCTCTYLRELRPNIFDGGQVCEVYQSCFELCNDNNVSTCFACTFYLTLFSLRCVLNLETLEGSILAKAQK